MKKLPFLIITLAMFQMYACRNQSPAQNPPPETSELTKSSPDNNDLLDALQGKWRSESDSTYVLEIVDTKMRHINQGQIGSETDLEVDGGCSNTSCQGADAGDGWCFLEKGAGEIQCYLVSRCDQTTLQFETMGPVQAKASFKKVK